MRYTCALDIPRLPAEVQLSVVTNAQLFCDTPMRPRLTPDDNGPAGTARTTPLTSPISGYQATPPYDPQAQASTYASSCFVPPGEPENGLLTGEK